MKEKTKYGDIIKELRFTNALPVRKVADFLYVDIILCSKIEKAKRNANWEIVKAVSSSYKQNY